MISKLVMLGYTDLPLDIEGSTNGQKGGIWCYINEGATLGSFGATKILN